MRPDREMSAWEPDDEPRRMPWRLLAFAAAAAGLIVAMVVR